MSNVSKIVHETFINNTYVYVIFGKQRKINQNARNVKAIEIEHNVKQMEFDFGPDEQTKH